jgi:hypothetical protein
MAQLLLELESDFPNIFFFINGALFARASPVSPLIKNGTGNMYDL